MTNEPFGVLLTPEQVWALSQAWYGNRMSPDYAGRTVAEVLALFADLGLTGPFWGS